MANKKTVKPAGANLGLPAAYYPLHALLGSMRCIARHEDALCELLHEMKATSELSSEAAEEIRILLEQLPSRDYLDDLGAAHRLLAAPRSRAS